MSLNAQNISRGTPVHAFGINEHSCQIMKNCFK
jgi:hypothetical protein